MFPFPKSPKNDPAGLPRTPGISSEERARFVIMGVLFLTVLGGIIGSYAYLNSRKPSASIPVAAPDAPPVPGELPPMEVTAVPLFPEEQRGEIEKSFAEQASSFAGILDGVAAPEPGPYDFLVDKATLDTRVLNLLPEGYDPEPPVEKVLADPGAFRGRMYRVTGELLSLEKTPYAGECKQVQEVRTGVVRDGKGRLWSFTWPLANSLEPDPVQPGKGWVRLHGLFYKTWPVADPAKGGTEAPSLHLVLARRIMVDYPEVHHRDIDPAWMAEVHDTKPEEMLSFDDDSFFRLLNLSKTLGPEGFEGWLKQKQAETPDAKFWPPEDMTGRYKELLARPDLWRFRPISCTAFLAKPSEVGRAAIRPNPGNVERLWIGFLTGTDFAPGIWVCAPRSFVDQGIKSEDQVRVEGIFYKRHAFRPANGKNLMQCAIVVAGRIVKVPISEKHVEMDVLLGIVALLTVLAASLAFLILQGRKEARATEARRVQRLSKMKVGPTPPTTPSEPGPGTGA
jgi:hypothetical protein